MNISVKPFYKILESYIKYYYYLLFLNKIGIKKFIQDLKKGKGLGGIFLRTFLTLIFKFLLFFILLGGFSSGIEFNNFLDHCSFLFLFDFNKISNMELYKIVAIIFLIIMSNIINIIELIEQVKKYRLKHLDKVQNS